MGSCSKAYENWARFFRIGLSHAFPYIEESGDSMIDPLGPDPNDSVSTSRKGAEVVSEFEAPGSLSPLRPKVRYANYDSPEAQLRKEDPPRNPPSPRSEATRHAEILPRRGGPLRIQEAPISHPGCSARLFGSQPALSPNPRLDPSMRLHRLGTSRTKKAQQVRASHGCSQDRSLSLSSSKMLPLLEGNRRREPLPISSPTGPCTKSISSHLRSRISAPAIRASSRCPGLPLRRAETGPPTPRRRLCRAPGCRPEKCRRPGRTHRARRQTGQAHLVLHALRNHPARRLDPFHRLALRPNCLPHPLLTQPNGLHAAPITAWVTPKLFIGPQFGPKWN